MVQLEFLIKCKFIDKIIKSFRVTTTEHENASQGHPSEPRSLESHVEPVPLLTLPVLLPWSHCCWPSLRPPQTSSFCLFIYFGYTVACRILVYRPGIQTQVPGWKRSRVLAIGPTGNSPDILPSSSQPLLGAGQNPQGWPIAAPCLCQSCLRVAVYTCTASLRVCSWELGPRRAECFPAWCTCISRSQLFSRGLPTWKYFCMLSITLPFRRENGS